MSGKALMTGATVTQARVSPAICKGVKATGGENSFGKHNKVENCAQKRKNRRRKKGKKVRRKEPFKRGLKEKVIVLVPESRAAAKAASIGANIKKSAEMPRYAMLP